MIGMQMNAPYSEQAIQLFNVADRVMQNNAIFETMLFRLEAATVEFFAHKTNGNREYYWNFMFESLQIVIRSVQEGLHIVDTYDQPEKFGKDISPARGPVGLIRLLVELGELRRGRVSPLLTLTLKRAGKHTYHFGRQRIHAGGAAAVEVLVTKTNMLEREAAQRVADVANKAGFLNQRGVPHTVLGVMDWRKHRTSKKENFHAIYDVWSQHFAAICEPRDADQRTNEDIQHEMLQLFKSFIDMFS